MPRRTNTPSLSSFGIAAPRHKQATRSLSLSRAHKLSVATERRRASVSHPLARAREQNNARRWFRET